MSTYREIVGKKIKKVSSDPSSGLDGEMWYNSTTGSLRGVQFLEAWVSSSKYITGRASFGSAGTQAANVIFGGRIPAMQNLTEEYNGSGWTSSGVIGSAGYAYRGFGIQTAAVSAGLFMGPGVQTTIYEYDGSTWTSANALPGGRACMGTAGTLTAGLAFSGSTGPFTSVSTSTFKYDGTNWTAGNALSTGRSYIGGFGTQTAAIGCGGYSGSPNNDTTTGATEEYDGTNWTAGGTMNTARRAFGTSGIQTAGLIFGGSDGSDKTATESYNGSSWTTSPATLAVANRLGGGSPAGSSTAALNTEGGASPYGATTQEFNASSTAYTAAAWSAGGNLPTPISSTQGGGTQTAGLQMSGQPSGPGTAASTAVNEYDGSAWTAGGAIAPGAASYGGQASKNGSQTAMLYWKGHYGGNKTTVSSYDGSSWTAQPTFPNSNVYGGGCGTSTAALSAGGTPTATTDEGDGSYNWTTGGTLGSGGYNMAAAGSQTSAVVAGGSPPRTQKTEEYDGSSWTTKSDIIVLGPNTKDMGFGTNSDDMMIAGGPPNKTDAVKWDGTAWATQPSISTGRQGGAGFGASSTSGVVAGGQSPFKTATEEFTGETSAINIKTFATS